MSEVLGTEEREAMRRLSLTGELDTNALDEAIALPTDFSARIARNTQIYLCYTPPDPQEKAKMNPAEQLSKAFQNFPTRFK